MLICLTELSRFVGGVQADRERFRSATRVAQAGIDVLTLAALLGHTSVQMTSRYVHPTDQHKREAIQKLEAYNADVIFKYGESVSGSLQKPLQ